MRRVFFALLLSLSPLLGAQSFLDRPVGGEAQMTIQVNNRVLASPNDQPISVLDLTRKLDVIFMQEYSDMADSIAARYQFYLASWRPILDQLINQELMLADAEEKEITIPDGEIHRELDEMFGPDVVKTLDELGMSYDEAWEMVRKDLIVSRMQGFMVHMRAFTSVNPAMVAQAYEEFAEQQSGQDEWHYRVLSIRHKDRHQALEIARAAETLIEGAEQLDLDEIKNQLESKRRSGEIDSRATIAVSELEKRTLSSLATSHRDAISNLSAGEWSEPVGQVSRVDRCMVYRIFHLVEFVECPPPSFKEIENQIQNHLIGMAAREHGERYVQRLREEYGITDDYLAQMIPSDFQPFALR